LKHLKVSEENKKLLETIILMAIEIEALRGGEMTSFLHE
jgi:hypothetical protein